MFIARLLPVPDALRRGLERSVEKQSGRAVCDRPRVYDVLTVSFRSRKETPELARWGHKKAAFVKRYRRPGAEQGWHFLVGDKQPIEQLAASVGFRYQYDERSNQYAHGAGIVVLTPEGQVSRYFYGIDYPPTSLRLALVESAAGKIGSPVDQFLLLCFHYDPATGRYGLAIARLLTWSGCHDCWCWAPTCC